MPPMYFLNGGMDKWMELRPAGKTSHSQTDSVGREQMPNFFRVNQTLSSHDYLVFLIKASPVSRIASGMEKWINRYWEKKHMNGHFPEKLGYLLKIKSWKGRMLFCDVTGHWIFRCQCPALDPKIPLRSFPSNSVGLVLGVAKPAGQHGDRGTANQAIFSWDALLDWPIPPSGVTYFKFKCIMALGSHHTPWKKKKNHTQGWYCTLWDSLAPGPATRSGGYGKGSSFSTATSSLLRDLSPNGSLCVWSLSNQGCKYQVRVPPLRGREVQDRLFDHQPKIKHQKPPPKPWRKSIIKPNFRARLGLQPSPAQRMEVAHLWVTEPLPDPEGKRKGFTGSSQSCRLWLAPRMSSLFILRDGTRIKQTVPINRAGYTQLGVTERSFSQGQMR